MTLRQTAVFLSPGECFVGDSRYRVRTLLGSCVSITLWHEALRVGAMSHFLLAERTAGQESTEQGLDGRYGIEALAMMFRGLMALGARAQDCEAKLFGGGAMFPSHSRLLPKPVGRRNGDAAESLLESHGIRVASRSLYGAGHRKVLFDIATGDVWSSHEKGAAAPAPLSSPAPHTVDADWLGRTSPSGPAAFTSRKPRP